MDIHYKDMEYQENKWKRSYLTFLFDENGLQLTSNKYGDFNAVMACRVLSDIKDTQNIHECIIFLYLT